VRARISRFLDSDAFPRALAVVFIVFGLACLAGVISLIEIVQAGQ
jgi:hypothetical protein